MTDTLSRLIRVWVEKARHGTLDFYRNQAQMDEPGKPRSGITRLRESQSTCAGSAISVCMGLGFLTGELFRGRSRGGRQNLTRVISSDGPLLNVLPVESNILKLLINVSLCLVVEMWGVGMTALTSG